MRIKNHFFPTINFSSCWYRNIHPLHPNMFKAKRKRMTLRKSTDDEDEETHNKETQELLAEAKKPKSASTGGGTTTTSTTNSSSTSTARSSLVPIASSFVTASGAPSHQDLATRLAEHHPVERAKEEETNDGIHRDTKRNASHAGPLKASNFIRTTARFDYQPDICKDYKETGFCGFGDTCIYLHDRGDTLAGWQIDQQWEEEQKKKKEKQEKAITEFMGKTEEDIDDEAADDGLPFACFLCREHFKDPVVTKCSHHFCEKCIMSYVRNATSQGKCPVCQKDTHSVFNQPTKLESKRKQVVGRKGTWEDFFRAKGKKTVSNESS